MKGVDIAAYNKCYHELATLCPEMISTTQKRIERYIRRLPLNIQGNVTSSKPSTLDETIRMSHNMMDQSSELGQLGMSTTITATTTETTTITTTTTTKENKSGNATQQPNKKQEVVKAYVAGPVEKTGYVGNLPKCKRCQRHHNPGPCPAQCGNCKKIGHSTKDCRLPAENQRTPGTCFGCGGRGHFKNDCPKKKNQGTGIQTRGAQGRIYALGGKEANEDPNVVSDTFLLNNHYALILFDSGADRSFVSTAFAPLLNITLTTLETAYSIELANDNLVGADTIM